MKNTISIAFLNLFFVISLFGQETSSMDSIQFKKAYSTAIQQINTISYKGKETYTKALSEVSKVKNFTINAKRNPKNKGYNFDWDLNELRSDSAEHVILFKENKVFRILKDHRIITVRQDVINLDEGAYDEFMRVLFLPDELIYDLPFSPLYECKFSENNDYYQVETLFDTDSKRIVFFNKTTFLPEKIESINDFPELNSQSIFSTVFSDYNINPTLPDTVLSPGYFVDQNYEIIANSTEDDKEMSKEKEASVELNNENIHKFLDTELSFSNGEQKTLRSIAGDNYLLLDFWFAGCGPCLQNMPRVEKLHRQYHNKGLTVYGVNGFDAREKEMIDKKMKEKGIISFPSLYSSRAFLREWSVTSFPTYLLLDKNGEIVFFDSGSDVLIPIAKFLSEKLD